jgi:predicted component of type VI protein secretion system
LSSRSCLRVTGAALARCAVGGAVVWAALGAFACSHGHDPASPTAASLADVVYEAPASDEALLELVTAKTQATGALSIIKPAANAQVSAAEVQVFQWSELRTAANVYAPRPQLQYALVAPAQPSLRKQLWELIGPEAEAFAHGEPTNGYAYLLSVTAAGGTAGMRVFTTKREYEPTADQWAKIKSLKGTINVTLRAAFFEDNRIKQAFGPVDAPPVTYTWKP